MALSRPRKDSLLGAESVPSAVKVRSTCGGRGAWRDDRHAQRSAAERAEHTLLGNHWHGAQVQSCLALRRRRVRTQRRTAAVPASHSPGTGPARAARTCMMTSMPCRCSCSTMPRNSQAATRGSAGLEQSWGSGAMKDTPARPSAPMPAGQSRAAQGRERRLGSRLQPCTWQPSPPHPRSHTHSWRLICQLLAAAAVQQPCCSGPAPSQQLGRQLRPCYLHTGGAPTPHRRAASAPGPRAQGTPPPQALTRGGGVGGRQQHGIGSDRLEVVHPLRHAQVLPHVLHLLACGPAAERSTSQ